MRTAEALARMAAVALDVEQVVDQVVGRCHKAEAEERRHHRCHRAGPQIVRKQKWRCQQQVLGPLVNANGFEERASERPPVKECLRHRDAPHPERHGQTARRVGHHGLLRMRQQRQVGGGVADVIEIARIGSSGSQASFPESGWLRRQRLARRQRCPGARPLGQPILRLHPSRGKFPYPRGALPADNRSSGVL